MEFNTENQYQGYVTRINRVLDFIDKNLNKKLLIEDLAKVAAFSPFHFHRIFTGIVGEPVKKYLKRRRIERAANLLLIEPNLNITEVANRCGFPTSSELARSFKLFFSMSATQWRNGGYKQRKEKVVTDKFKKSSNYPADIKLNKFFIDPNTHNQKWEGTLNSKKAIIEVKKEVRRTVAYIRLHENFFDNRKVISDACERIMCWAKTKDIINKDSEIITIMHDNPHITEAAKLRTDICINLPDYVDTEGDIGRSILSGGLYGVGSFCIEREEVHSAWNFISSWLFRKSTYILDNTRKCYSVYKTVNGNSENILYKIYLPVKFQ